MSKSKSVFNNEKNLPTAITEKEILDIFQNIPGYAECNIQEYFIYFYEQSYREYYEKVDSNKQFKALLELSKYQPEIHKLEYIGFNIINRLLNIICKKKKYSYHQKVLWIMRTSRNDNEVYDFLKKTSGNRKNNNFKKKFKTAEKFKKLNCNSSVLFGQMFGYRSKNFKDDVNIYLDLGCGKGVKTLEYAKNLGITDPKKIHCVEVDEFQEQKDWWKTSNNNLTLKIIKPNEKYPYKKGTFDLISAFMVLHHIDDLDFVLKEVNRVCKKGGHFIIKEHDVFNYADWMLADIEHNMWTEVWGQDTDRSLRPFNKAYYRNWPEWAAVMARYGFKHVAGGSLSPSINYNLTATRAFYGLYQKIKDVK